VLCAVTIPPADLRSLSLYYYAIRACLVFLSVGDLLVSSQADNQQTITPNTHR
jgi:hypothetical protein